MALKPDDALNVDIDPAIILCYELEKINLDGIPNDIFDEVTDESPKNDDKIDVKNINKITEFVLSNCTEIMTEKISTVEDKSFNAKIKDEIPSEYSEIKKDINGNDESVSEENLKELFDQLELSDSDNEEIDVTERGPVRASKIRRDHRKKDAKNVWCKTVDKTQLNSECLKFWSGGSSQIQVNEIAVPYQYALYNNNQAIIYEAVEPSNNLSSLETYFDDARASSVSSPESGYDSSSAHSESFPPPSPPPCLPSSPPCPPSPPSPLYTPADLDNFIPETVDDQNIWEFLINTDTDGAFIDNRDASNINDKDAKIEINKILNFLKDTPPELNESSDATTISHNVIDPVPFSSQPTISTTSVVKPSPVSVVSDSKQVPLNAVSKHVEIKPKLKEKAKAELKTFLSEEEYNAAKLRIYAKIREDKKNGKPESVIYVADEMDKDSKNRTNLHNAVLNGKVEDIFSIVEINKQYGLSFTGINIRDKCGKTALDYAIENKMTLIADYLKENTACQSVNL